MRNSKRIKPIVKELEKFWNTVPDWRFTQLLSNLAGILYEKNGNNDPFYVEDDVTLENMKELNKKAPPFYRLVRIDLVREGESIYLDVPDNISVDEIKKAVKDLRAEGNTDAKNIVVSLCEKFKLTRPCVPEDVIII